MWEGKGYILVFIMDKNMDWENPERLLSLLVTDFKLADSAGNFFTTFPLLCHHNTEMYLNTVDSNNKTN